MFQTTNQIMGYISNTMIKLGVSSRLAPLGSPSRRGPEAHRLATPGNWDWNGSTMEIDIFRGVKM